MKAGMPRRPIATALIKPTPRPATSVSRAAGTRSSPCPHICAKATPQKAATDPTERSIPAITIVHMTPIATIAAIEVCRMILLMLFSVRKLGVASDKRDPQRDREGNDIGLDRQAPEPGVHEASCSGISNRHERGAEPGPSSQKSVDKRPAGPRIPAGRLQGVLSCRRTRPADASRHRASRRASGRPCWLWSPCRRPYRRSSAAVRHGRRHSRTRPRRSPSCMDPG